MLYRLFPKAGTTFPCHFKYSEVEKLTISVDDSLSDDCSISSHSDASLSSSVYSKEEQYILSALSRSNPKTYGFIVFKENEAFGIGNVYRSFASVFLLAIVTNRTLFGICVSEYS